MLSTLYSLLLVFALPAVAFEAARSYQHLYRKIDPDPVHRFMRAAGRWISLMTIGLIAWLVCATVILILFGDNRFWPVALAAAVMKGTLLLGYRVPINWWTHPPLVSRDRNYQAFLEIVAERAAEVKGTPEKRAIYLRRMYENDYVRMQVIADFLREHQHDTWITLSYSQSKLHPNHYRLIGTTIYIIALLPVILPFLLRGFGVNVTEDNFSLTLIASIAAAILYSPLFDQATTWFLALCSVGLVVCIALLMENRRLKTIIPGVTGLFVCAISGTILWDYFHDYVIVRTDTPLVQAINYLLVQLEKAVNVTANTAQMIEEKRDGVLIGPFVRVALDGINSALGFNSLDELRNINQWTADMRNWVLRTQSRIGGYFILPATCFWGGLSVWVLWELHFSNASDVTFHHRMRKPEI